MLAKLKSRKFWLVFGFGAVALFAESLGLSQEAVGQILGPLMAYLLGQSYVDARKA